MYFDGGIFVGREPKYGLFNDEKEISNNLSERSVDQALAVHFEAVYYDMFSGNARMLELAQNSQGKLVPLAVINPLHYDSTENYLDELKQDGFRGISLLPHYQYWKIDQYVTKHLAVELCNLGLPIQIGVANLSELNQIITLFKNCQSPILIRWIRGGGYNSLADEIAISQDYKQFYFDVSNVVAIGQIELLAQKIGSERLFISSNSPLVYEASPFLLLESSELNADDRTNIAYRTLEKIFAVETVAKNTQTILQKYEAHITRPKIDVHWHTHGWDILEPGKELPVMKKVFDSVNYKKVICSSVMALNYDMVKGNQETSNMIATDDRMYAYIVIDPIRPEESIKELEKYKHNSHFIGIKTIQDYYEIGIDDPRYTLMLQWAEANEYPLLCHRNGVIDVAKKYPRLKIIAAHISWERLDQMGEVATLPNLWLDVSGSYAHRGETNLATLIQTVGVDHILFSSDGPLISPYWALGKWAHITGLTEADWEKIYRTNALAVFPQLNSYAD